jgi:hypothetical protein
LSIRIIAGWNWATHVLDLIRTDTSRLQIISITITRDQLAYFSRDIAGHTVTRRCFRARDATRLAMDNAAHFVVVATAVAFDFTMITTMIPMSTVSGVITIKFNRGSGSGL